MEDEEIRLVLNTIIEMIHLHRKLNPKCTVNDVLNLLNEVLDGMNREDNPQK